MIPEDVTRKALNSWGLWGDLIAGSVPLALLASLAGVVRSMQAGRCGLKAVAIAALSAGFTGCLVHLMLDQTGLPAGYRAALVGVSGYASGELLKIVSVRMCKWAERYTPRSGG